MLKPRAESELFFKRIRSKVVIFTLIITTGFTLGALRLWNLQVVQHQSLAHRADQNRIREVTLTGLRGRIYDRNGVPLVDNRPSFDLFMVPEDNPDPDKTFRILSQKIDLDTETLKKTIKRGRAFAMIPLKRDISRDEVAFVEERRNELPGIYLQVTPIRNYIHGDFASHLLGYLGAISPAQYAQVDAKYYSRTDLIGKAGVEKMEEENLRGLKGRKLMEVDATGRQLSVIGKFPPKSGADLTLTLDYDAQKAGEEAFGDSIVGSAVALDPENGDILAFISKPAYDPNAFAYGISPTAWRKLLHNTLHPLQNRALQGQYPPGSTFKLLIAAAALEEGLITKETQIHCPGYYRFGRRSYRCWKKGGHGWMDLHHAIVQSCDVFFYKTGLQLGVNKIAEYAHRFGLGEKSNLGFPHEKRGLIPTTKWKLKYRKQKWIAGETVSVSIGQGYVLTTPMQLARMAAVFANGGRLISPRVITGATTATPSPPVVSPQNIAMIRDAMRGVVYEQHGTAWRLRLGKRPWEYAGKTGTAQVIRMKQNEEWDKNIAWKFQDHALFVAFAPYDNPKIAVAVVGEHAGHGGEVAAPIARAIIDAYLKKEFAKEKKSLTQPKGGDGDAG